MAGAHDRPRVVVLNDVEPGYYAEFPRTLDALAGRAEVAIHAQEAHSMAELAEWLRGAWAAIDIRARSSFDAALLQSLPELRVIVVRGTTAPLVDLAAASRQGVLVCNTPYQSTEAVSEYALALLLASVRRVRLMDARLRRGEWQSQRGFLLRGKTLGVIGLGMIGQAMCRLGRGIGLRVIAWTPSADASRAADCGAELVPLEALLRVSDAVSLHLRLSDRTRGLLGRRELALLKDGAILVNTARAGLLDEAALFDELRSGRLIGALDVFGQEPLPPDHPLLELDNVIVTPHAAWATDEVRESRAQVPVENALAALEGRPQNVLNPAALEHAVWCEPGRQPLVPA